MTPYAIVQGDAPVKCPYPWFGGKAQVAPLVWNAFGNVHTYIEPFFGGGAVLLRAPWPSKRIETINDINAWLCNFWRAVKTDPDQVAFYAADPVSELDLHARGDWLFYRPGVDVDFVERLRSDPDYYDPKSAGWWCWGQSSWIGDNWGRKECRKRPHLSSAGMGVNRQRPRLGDAGKGVNRQRPHLGDAGVGVNRQRPHLGDAGHGVNRQRPHLGDAGMGDETTRLVSIREYMRQLCERMAGVRVCCGDWSRVLGPAITISHGRWSCGVFLDPPYAVEDRGSVYGEHEDRDVANDVREWCREWGKHPSMRIVLCGYAGEHDDLTVDGWTTIIWKASGGYGNQSDNNDNRGRERMWLSPHCLRQEVMGL